MHDAADSVVWTINRPDRDIDVMMMHGRSWSAGRIIHADCRCILENIFRGYFSYTSL
jgi:hypothetical protein